jgi:hypothetical protein
MTPIGTAEHARHLHRQVEQIADTAQDRTVQIIVQMGPTNELKQFLETSAEIMRRRQSIVSARELVPPRWQATTAKSKRSRRIDHGRTERRAG